VKASGRGWRASPRCPLSSVRMVIPRVCPAGRVGVQANQPGSARALGPWYDVGHVGTDIWAKPSNCAEALKASGIVLGWRHPKSGDNPLVIRRHAAEPSTGILGGYPPRRDPALLRLCTGGTRYPVVLSWESGSRCRLAVSTFQNGNQT
jgi:hypothetical protein